MEQAPLSVSLAYVAALLEAADVPPTHASQLLRQQGLDPDDPGARLSEHQFATLYRSLAIAQSLAGHLDDARATVDQLLIYEPNYSVRLFLERSPGAKFGQGERFAQALREAGLPENA